MQNKHLIDLKERLIELLVDAVIFGVLLLIIYAIHRLHHSLYGEDGLVFFKNSPISVSATWCLDFADFGSMSLFSVRSVWFLARSMFLR